MLDIKLIRQNPDIIDINMERRGSIDRPSAVIIELDQRLRSEQTRMQTAQAERNRLAKEFGQQKREGKDTTGNIAASEQLKHDLAASETAAKNLEEELYKIMAMLPNILLDDVPEGKSESDNVVLRTWGTPRTFAFTPRAHDELGATLGLMDFERAAKISGARFVALYGKLAQLERAIARFMLDIHVKEFGYTEVYPPYLVLEKTLQGTGHLPKFREDMFATNSGHMLISTAEVSLTALVGDEILPAAKLPLRLCAYSPCFRSEAGAAGKDTRGMVRNHQFTKVELVSLTMPNQTNDEHERMTNAAETILQKLELPYRVIALCTGDMGFQSSKTYDLEVWLPSQETYREISSCSQCGDFQTRRLNARYRGEDGKPALMNSLNGSGLAVGRTLVAILENYQNADGSVTIPNVLIPYMDGQTIIEPTQNPIG
ncbi:MAG: serine--tRNA ligase [Alphaproteobacteria bacterium]|nr:serine--tRNA ligase [Alphaproteobacteria bacterium]